MSDRLKRRQPRTTDPTAAGYSPAAYGDEAFAKKYPLLLEFLSLELWEPGVPRTKGSLFLFLEDGCFKACLNDKDTDEVAFVTKPSFAALLDAVERGLAQGTLDWRLSTQGKARRNGRR